MAIASSSESTRLAPIGDVTKGTGSDSGTTVSGEESAPNEPTTERSSGGSATGSTLSADGRTGEVTPRRSCSVPTSQYSTTAWTLLSAVTMTTSVEASTSCTSSLVEVPQETVMRGAVGGLRGWHKYQSTDGSSARERTRKPSPQENSLLPATGPEGKRTPLTGEALLG